MQSFDSRVKNSYSSVLAAMTEFVRSFLDLGTSVGKTTSLVKALADLVMQDSTIEDTEEFFIGSKGEKIKKAAFSDLSMFFNVLAQIRYSPLDHIGTQAMIQ